MKKMILSFAAIALLALPLGGCLVATDPATGQVTVDPSGSPVVVPSVGTITPGTIASVITEVQADTQTACGIIAQGQSIADLFLSGNPTYQSVTSIVKALCQLAKTKSASLRRRAAVSGDIIGVINGVPIRLATRVGVSRATVVRHMRAYRR